MKKILPFILLLFAVTSFAQSPSVSGSLSSELTSDPNSNTKVDPGDKVTYTTTITNSGSGNATSVKLTSPAPSNTTLAPGSVKTSALARDDDFSTLFNTILNQNALSNDFGLPTISIKSFGTSATPGSTTVNGSNTAASDQGGTVLFNTNGVFSYTPALGFVGYDKFGYTALTGLNPTSSAVITVKVGTPVTANNDIYAINGNIANSQDSSTGLLNNDTGDKRTITAVNGSSANIGVQVSTTQNGSVTVQADGSFVYNPPSGYEGADSFSYTTDNALTQPSTATVNLNISGMIWFVNNNAPTNGNGTLLSPFNSLASFNLVNNGSGNNPASGDNIFIYGGGADYTGGLNLLANQKVIGQGASATLEVIAGITLAIGGADLPVTGGANPVITNLSGNGITLGSNNLLRGLTIGHCSAISISGTAFGTLAVSEVSINNGVSSAMILTNGSVNGSFASISSAASSGNNISLTTVGGSFVINGGSLAGASGPAFNISGGSATITYSGSLSQVNNAAMVSIAGGNTGTITFQTGTLSASNGTGLQFNDADGTYNFNGLVNLNGGDAGIDIINGSSGNFTFVNAPISNPTGAAFVINGGNGTISHAGAISKISSGRLVDIQSRSGGTVTLSGNLSSTASSTGFYAANNTSGTIDLNGPAKTFTTGINKAITLSTNTGSVINFNNGGLAITTTTGNGFEAIGGGTITIGGSNNFISSTGGIALNVANTTIGSSGFTFKSISANGGSNGIVLDNTGVNAGLTITGDGALWASGGIIQNTIGADGATAGNGIYLNSTRNVSLNFMKLGNHSNNGIYGAGVRGFTMFKTRFVGSHGTSNSGTYNESSVRLVDVGGSVSVKNSYFSGGAMNSFRIDNTSGTAPIISSLEFDTDTLTTMQGSTADVRGTALLVNLMDGSLTNGTIRNSHFDYWWGNAIHVLSQGTASATVSIANNKCVNTNGALAGAGGIWVGGGNLSYTITGNNIQNTNGTAISADRGNFGTIMQGTISNNTIGTSGVVNSGSGTGIAIFASHRGKNTTSTTIKDNVIRQVNGSANGAITAVMGDDVGFGDAGGGNFNCSIIGNNIQETGSTLSSAQHGILLTIGVTSSGSTGGDNGVGCFNIGGAGPLANVITNFNSLSAPAAQNRIRVNQRFKTTAKFPGYTGGNGDSAALSSYLLGRNQASNTAIANNTSFPGPGFTNSDGGLPCAQ